MSLTREEAEQIAKEAIAQGWAEEANSEEYRGFDGGSITVYDWDDINRQREELGNGSLGGKGCSVELHFPTMSHGSDYWVSSTEEWRKLKAKTDEMREIVKQATQRGWQLGRQPLKVGKLGMMVEVVPPGTASYLPKRIGNMANWRKLCREYDEMIEIHERPAIEGQATGEAA